MACLLESERLWYPMLSLLLLPLREFGGFTQLLLLMILVGGVVLDELLVVLVMVLTNAWGLVRDDGLLHVTVSRLLLAMSVFGGELLDALMIVVVV